MKILFWTGGFWPRIGGVETQGFHFVKELLQRGHECTVLADKDCPDWKDTEYYQGIRIDRIDFDRIYSSVLVNKTLSSLRVLTDYLSWASNEYKPDVIHLNQCIGTLSILFLLFHWELSAPVVLTMHSTYSWDPYLQKIIEKSALRANQIGCVSMSVLDEVKTFFPQLKGKCRLIYNGLSLPEIAPSPLPFSPPTLLIAGRLSAEKGFDVAIQAFSLLKKRGSDAQLLIVGDGPICEQLKDLASRLELLLSVRFAGSVSQEEIPAYINQSTIVLVPSFFESFGLTALEALQLERPVIASRVGGLVEIISDGETGLLIPPKDPIALCGAIQTLLSDPQKTIKMGIDGRKSAMERFSLQKNVEQYINLYEELRCNPSLV